MKKRMLMTIAAVVAAVPAIFLLKSFSGEKDTVTYVTVRVEKGNITNTVTATGTIGAMTTVRVGTQVSGILKGVYVDFNDVVKKGELLAQLDETSLRTQVEQSQALVDQAQAQLNYNESTYKRMKVLYGKDLISQADYDQAVFNYENSKGALVNAKSNLERSEVSLGYAAITSPIDGVVLNRAVEEGQTVAASFNTPELFTIVNDLTQMEVQTSVDEADIGKVSQGQRVEFTVDAYPDLIFTGEVSEVRLQPVTTNNVVTYVVIISAPNPGKKLMPGMTASATIYVEEKDNTLILSRKALIFRPDTTYLNKIMTERAGQRSKTRANTLQKGMSSAQIHFRDPSGPAGKASDGMLGQTPGKTRMIWVRDGMYGLSQNRVTTGIDNGTNVEILSGLNEGDEVIISMKMDSKKSSSTGSVKKDGARLPALGPGTGG